MPVVVTRNQFVGLKVVNGAAFKAVDIFPDFASGTIALASDVTLYLGPPVAVLLQSDGNAGLAIPGLPNGMILIKSKTVAVPAHMQARTPDQEASQDSGGSHTGQALFARRLSP
jgi:hypothetical protein